MQPAKQVLKECYTPADANALTLHLNESRICAWNRSIRNEIEKDASGICGMTACHVLEDDSVSRFVSWIVRRKGSRRDPLRVAQRFIAGAQGSNCQLPSRRDGMSATRVAQAVPPGRQCAGECSSQSQPSKGWAIFMSSLPGLCGMQSPRRQKPSMVPAIP